MSSRSRILGRLATRQHAVGTLSCTGMVHGGGAWRLRARRGSRRSAGGRSSDGGRTGLMVRLMGDDWQVGEDFGPGRRGGRPCDSQGADGMAELLGVQPGLYGTKGHHIL